MRGQETKQTNHVRQPIIDHDSVGINTPIVSWETDDAVYWYSMQTRHPESFLTVVETSHYDQNKLVPDPGVPKSVWKAMKDPPWAKAIDTELTKFETKLLPHRPLHWSAPRPHDVALQRKERWNKEGTSSRTCGSR